MNVKLSEFKILTYDGEKIEVEVSSIEELSSLLSLAREMNLPIYTIPVDDSIDRGIWVYLSLSDVPFVIKKTSMLVSTPLDIELDDFQGKLVKEGLTWGHYPLFSSGRKTLREYFAIGFGLQNSTFFSRSRDFYTSGYFMLPDGRRFKTVLTPRSAAGPDVGRFLMGSWETLAIVLQLNTRVYQMPPSYLEAAFSYYRWSDLVEEVKEIFARRTTPDHLLLVPEAVLDDLFGNDHPDGNLVLLRLPVYDEKLSELRLRFVEKILKRGKRIPEEESAHLFRKALDHFERSPALKIYSALWSRIKELGGHRIVISGCDVEGAGVIPLDGEEFDDLTMTYHYDIKAMVKDFKKKFPVFYNIFTQLKRKLDPHNLLNPHILEV